MLKFCKLRFPRELQLFQGFIMASVMFGLQLSRTSARSRSGRCISRARTSRPSRCSRPSRGRGRWESYTTPPRSWLWKVWTHWGGSTTMAAAPWTCSSARLSLARGGGGITASTSSPESWVPTTYTLSRSASSQLLPVPPRYATHRLYFLASAHAENYEQFVPRCYCPCELLLIG